MRRIIILITLLVFTQTTFAQTTTNSSSAQTANLALSNAIELTFMNGSGGTSTMLFNSLNDLVNGVESSPQQLRVRSNKTFKITASTIGSKFSYQGNSLLNTLLSVVSVLKISCTQASTGNVPGQLGSWKNFSLLTPTTILTDGAPGGNQTFTVKYKATPGLNVAAGVYTTTVRFTATQQ